MIIPFKTLAAVALAAFFANPVSAENPAASKPVGGTYMQIGEAMGRGMVELQKAK